MAGSTQPRPETALSAISMVERRFGVVVCVTGDKAPQRPITATAATGEIGGVWEAD